MAEELTAEIVLATDVADDPQLSPDGRWLVWTAQAHTYEGEHPVASLWLAEVASPGSARRFSADGEHRDHHPRWSPTGEALAFLTDRAERGTDSLAVLSVRGGEAELLIERRGRGIDTFAWSPEGRRIAVVAPDERDDADERRERERDDAEVYGERWPYAGIRIVDVEDGQVTNLPTGERHVLEVAWSPDARAVAFLASPTPTLDSHVEAALFHLDLDAEAPRRLAATPDASSLTWVRSDEDRADRLAWVAPREPVPQCSSAVWSIQAEGGEPRVETTDLDVCEIGLRGTPDGRDAVVLVADGLGTRLRWLSGGIVHDEPDGDIRTAAVHRDGDGATLALLRSTGVEPWELWTPVDGHLHRVSDHQQRWLETDLAEQSTFHWTAEDGLDLDGIVLRPRGASGPLPSIVLAHGGPYARWANGFSGTLGNWGQWLATAGYQLLMPNPRGGMGHGNGFARSVRGEVGQADFADIMAMVDAAAERGLADPDRLGICGWSQGGFMAAWAVTQTDRFKAAIVGAGVSDWGMLTMDTDVPAFEAALGGSRPWDGPGPHRSCANSPISFAAQVSTPVLILHGKDDARIPVNQAIGFARALRENGVEVEQVLYPRSPHAPRERKHQLDIHRRLRAWFDRWL